MLKIRQASAFFIREEFCKEDHEGSSHHPHDCRDPQVFAGILASRPLEQIKQCKNQEAQDCHCNRHQDESKEFCFHDSGCLHLLPIYYQKYSAYYYKHRASEGDVPVELVFLLRVSDEGEKQHQCSHYKAKAEEGPCHRVIAKG